MVKPKNDIKRESYSVRLDPVLLRELKHAGVDQKKPVSLLIEEGIRLLLKKYQKK